VPSVESSAPDVPALKLPDPGDRHVLAAAIRAGAQTIVTSNIGDFPNRVLSRYDLEAKKPDAFLLGRLIDIDLVRVADATTEQPAVPRKPPVDRDEFLVTLERNWVGPNDRCASGTDLAFSPTALRLGATLTDGSTNEPCEQSRCARRRGRCLRESRGALARPFETRVQNGYVSPGTRVQARPPQERKNGTVSSENVAARVREWTRVAYSSFPAEEELRRRAHPG
jgi:hypothetical protein